MLPIRILIVDDSPSIRRQLGELLESDPEIVVAGMASTGLLALERIAELKPDLITLDAEIPGMHGITTLVEIHKRFPALPVIMFSPATGPGARATVEALARGASDYAAEPFQAGSLEIARERVCQELVPKIKALGAAHRQLPKPSGLPTQVFPVSGGTLTRIDVVAIGSSTGGPNALAELMPNFSVGFPVPILIVQHMPAMFTALLSERLNSLTPLHVRLGVDGQILEPGQVWIAPGDQHMTVVHRGDDRVLRLSQDPPENSCRPAVDALFRSLAQSCGANVLAVVLTGMGSDGTKGAAEIRKVGGTVIVQDEVSSVVWGMPGSVVTAGLANRVCSLNAIAGEILRRTALWRNGAKASHV